MKMKEMAERAAAEDKRAASEERLAVAEDKKAEAEHHRVQLEERKAAAAELAATEEKEEKIMFMDTSGVNAKQKAFVELCKDQIWRGSP